MRTLARAQPSPAVAGAMAVPPRVRKEALTGGASPSVTRRRRKGGSDERDPPVSDPQREEGARAQRPHGPACGPFGWASPSSSLFFFFFLLFKNA